MFLLDLLARTLADVLLPEGTHVKHAPVKQGWWYRTYVPGNMVLEGLETEAREAKNGCACSNPATTIPSWCTIWF
jgi:hypothetical protein